MNKKDHGAFYTTKAHKILEDFKNHVDGKTVIDPFCGKRDLLKWAEDNGASFTIGCDINPQVNPEICANTIMHPMDYSHYDIVLMNPPYLLNNKTRIKAPFAKYKVTDLYKASLLSVINTANEFIAIIPSNMFFDNDDKFREKLYSNFEIDLVKIFDEQMFDDTNVRVAVIHAKRGTTSCLFGHELYKTRVGAEWFQLLEKGDGDFKRLTKDGKNQNFPTNICIKTTDTGSIGGEIKAYIGKPFYGKISDRNLMTLVAPYNMPKEIQKKMVKEFNSILAYYRNRYYSMFLTNFLAGKDKQMRKRISFKDALSLMSVIHKGIKNERKGDTKRDSEKI